MRTTVRLESALMKRAKSEAVRSGQTLTSLIEKGLRLVLTQPARLAEKPAIQLPVCRKGGGTKAGVDIANSAGLLDHMEGIQ
jgi:hypothetical protein